jgi:crotonobetainyl-CoA:carnitine CoA-transferase CaiB-like acyl-CoA transferase
MVQREIEARFLPRYRILDLADEKGAFCGKLLGDLGADVIKVEPPGGDRMRFRGPFYKNQVHPEKSLFFLYFNTGKGSITLNLEDDAGRVLFRRLVKKADAVVESFEPGYLASLGLDYPKLRKINPRLVMCSVTPFGQNGPHSSYKATDIVVMAVGGYMQLTGEPDRPPLLLGGEQSFYPGAQYAAVGILAALYYRDSVSGKGQYIDVSMQEAVLTYLHEQMPVLTWYGKKEDVSRLGYMEAVLTPFGLYPCKDGWTAIGLVTSHEWKTLAQWVYEVTGNAEILDPKYDEGGFLARMVHRDMVNAMIIDFTTRLTGREIFLEGQRRGLAISLVNTVDALIDDPHLNESGFWVELEHPVVGSSDIPEARFIVMPLGGQEKQLHCWARTTRGSIAANWDTLRKTWQCCAPQV